MYPVCSQTPFTHGSYLGDAASLSVHEAVRWEGHHHPAGEDRSEVLTDRCRPASRYPHSNGHHELGKVSPSPETVLLQRTRVRSACAPSSVRAPFHSWRWAAGYVRAPPPHPSALPSFPNLPGLCGMNLGWSPPPQASCLHFPVPRIQGQGNQGASVFCVCSRGLLSKINTHSSISTIQGDHVTAGA